MSDFFTDPGPFISKIITIVEQNMEDEKFGVTELAGLVNMSRSNLLRRVKQETGLSVSVFIRQVRLRKSELLLKEGLLTVSEISYKVGFNSTSYFTKCFRELYGYTPGEYGKRDKSDDIKISDSTVSLVKEQKPAKFVKFSIVSAVATAVLLFVLFKYAPIEQPQVPKSIAVLPFINDSNDSTNVYFMNGLMEAILDNFQKIEDIKVTSRTTVEKYRDLSRSIPELSRELNVNYFVEGSGQKVGDQILLKIQLIDANSDEQLWSQSYRRELEDVFLLQTEVAKNIADEIDAIITPDEYERIERIPTQNLVAYDYYLKGLELLKEETGEGLLLGIEQFKKAILEDGQFANAYAYIAVSYYYLDIFQAEKKYSEELKNYMDKALLLDESLGESLIAKALYYMHLEEYDQAVTAFENVLSYYPHSSWVRNSLSDIYTTYLPSTEKYLEHALQGFKFAVIAEDSPAASITYLHLSNALAQTGFIDEAETHVKKSLEYNPQNIYSDYMYAYIRMAQDYDLENAKESLLNTFEKDTTRPDVIQEVAKIYYYLEDYESSWKYYSKLIYMKYILDLDIYPGEDVKIAFVLNQLGKTEEAKTFLENFLGYAEANESIYRELSLSAYYASVGDIEKGIEHLKNFSKEDDYHYWLVLFFEDDPIMRQLSGHPDFEETVQRIKDQFWAKHEELKEMLEEEGVI